MKLVSFERAHSSLSNESNYISVGCLSKKLFMVKVNYKTIPNLENKKYAIIPNPYIRDYSTFPLVLYLA